MHVDGYIRAKLLHSSASSQVYEAVCEADASPVILKRHLLHPDDLVRSRAQNELEALRKIACAGVPRVLELLGTPDGPVLALERMPGIPLHKAVATTPLSIGAWLQLATQLTELLACVHEARVLHRHIDPSNVLFDAQAGRAAIVGFGSATELGAAELSGSREPVLGISFACASPEQTGRMSRGCDVRSDLYSLGATLYQALTGRPVFESTDPLELMHCHIARVPESPSIFRPEVPDVLSALLLKLLRKEPDERYQSARGLLFDLRACQEQWARSHEIDPSFRLGAAEGPDRARFTDLLCGRDREIEILKDACAQAERGELRCIVIRAAAGVGKTSLVSHLRGRLDRSTFWSGVGTFAPGRDRPYEGWVSVLESLAQQLLLQSDERLARWRSELLHGLGNIAGALIQLVPDLGLILGDVSPMPLLGPRETQARLSLALQRMLGVLATPEHPLIVFLDDLHGCDAGSRQLLEDVVASELPLALAFIVALRDDDPEHPAEPVLQALTHHGARVKVLNLEGLSTEAVAAMLAKMLERSTEEVLPLARWIRDVTGSNPLMIRQLLDHLRDRALLRFEVGVGWTWDVGELARVDIPESAVSLLVAKIDRVEPLARSLLQIATCIGRELDSELLASLSGVAPDEGARSLALLCDAGLLVRTNDGFSFLHDRIREAAQSQLPDDERSRLCFESGRHMLLRASELEQTERVFEIVEQLDRGLPHVTEELRWTVIEFNMSAGRRALGAGAAATADRYFAVARQLLRAKDWEERRKIVFGLYLDSAECAFQIGSCEDSLALLAELELRPLDRMERARLEAKRIQVFALTQHPDACSRNALAVLRRFGVRWPLHPSRLRVYAALIYTEWMLRGDRASRLRPATKLSPAWLASLLILHPAGGAMARCDIRLALLAACSMLRCAVRYGYVASPSFTLAAYALYLYSWLFRPRRSLALGQLALEWIRREPDPVRATRAEMMVHALLHPWLMPRRRALAPMERVAQAFEEMGDREFAYYAYLNHYAALALAGDPVPISEQRLRKVAQAARRASLLCPDEGERIYAVYTLVRAALSPDTLERHVAASDGWIASHPSSADPYIRTFWLLVLCVHGRFDLAFLQSEVLGGRLYEIVPYVHVVDHTFFRGLAAAVLAGDARGKPRRARLRALRGSLRRLRRWTRGNPDFAHMVLLLEAEQARLSKKVDRARAFYDKAAQQARKQSFLHHAALVQERHAALLSELRRHTEAHLAIRDAISLYRQWGALAKADVLAEAAGIVPS